MKERRKGERICREGEMCKNERMKGKKKRVENEDRKRERKRKQKGKRKKKCHRLI